MLSDAEIPARRFRGVTQDAKRVHADSLRGTFNQFVAVTRPRYPVLVVL